MSTVAVTGIAMCGFVAGALAGIGLMAWLRRRREVAR